MAYQVKDLASYVPKYQPLQERSDQEVYDFSINPQTNAADQTNATGELRRRNMLSSAPAPLPTFQVPQVAVPNFAGPGARPPETAVNPIPVMPWSREGTVVQANARALSDYTARVTQDYARGFTAPVDTGYTATVQARKARTVRQAAENLVGNVLTRFGVPRSRLAGRGAMLQTAYASPGLGWGG